MNDNGTPKRSGETLDDVIKHILDDMYSLLKGKKALDADEDEDPDLPSEVEVQIETVPVDDNQANQA